MAYPAYIRDKAVELRRRGLTLDEVTDRLALPRTTVYSWIKDIPIERTRRQTEAQRKAAESNSAQARLAREAAYRLGVYEFEALATEVGFIDFVCMYIGEGSKRNRNVVAVANSDPDVVLLTASWVRRFSRNPVRFSVQHHADQDLQELRVFWSLLLDIRPSEVRFQRKSNSNQLAKRTWRSQFGVLTVVASDTFLRARLQAWMDLVKQRWIDSVASGRSAAW